jgi:hypothetical protein
MAWSDGKGAELPLLPPEIKIKAMIIVHSREQGFLCRATQTVVTRK